MQEHTYDIYIYTIALASKYVLCLEFMVVSIYIYIYTQLYMFPKAEKSKCFGPQTARDVRSPIARLEQLHQHRAVPQVLRPWHAWLPVRQDPDPGARGPWSALQIQVPQNGSPAKKNGLLGKLAVQLGSNSMFTLFFHQTSGVGKIPSTNPFLTKSSNVSNHWKWT